MDTSKLTRNERMEIEDELKGIGDGDEELDGEEMEQKKVDLVDSKMKRKSKRMSKFNDHLFGSKFVSVPNDKEHSKSNDSKYKCNVQIAASVLTSLI